MGGLTTAFRSEAGPCVFDVREYRVIHSRDEGSSPVIHKRKQDMKDMIETAVFLVVILALGWFALVVTA